MLEAVVPTPPAGQRTPRLNGWRDDVHPRWDPRHQQGHWHVHSGVTLCVPPLLPSVTRRGGLRSIGGSVRRMPARLPPWPRHVGQPWPRAAPTWLGAPDRGWGDRPRQGVGPPRSPRRADPHAERRAPRLRVRTLARRRRRSVSSLRMARAVGSRGATAPPCRTVTADGNEAAECKHHHTTHGRGRVDLLCPKTAADSKRGSAAAASPPPRGPTRPRGGRGSGCRQGAERLGRLIQVGGWSIVAGASGARTSPRWPSLGAPRVARRRRPMPFSKDSILVEPRRRCPQASAGGGCGAPRWQPAARGARQGAPAARGP